MDYLLFFLSFHTERRSHITGKSVHNQRIERLWRDLWCIVSSNYYAAFRHLEDIGELDPDLDIHLIYLHYVMIPRINMHLQLFRGTWDNHPMSSESNKSPQQLWISGLLLNQGSPTHTVNNHLDNCNDNHVVRRCMDHFYSIFLFSHNFDYKMGKKYMFLNNSYFVHSYTGF